MRRLTVRLAAAALAAVVAVPLSAASGPVEDASGCDPIDPALCLLPFPNDHFTVADPTTPTGRRVHVSALAAPRSLGVVPNLPDEWNRNDGFSPGSMVLTFVPGIDLHQTWGAGSVQPPEHRDHIADISRYAVADAPILIVNATTGERHPFWSELDMHRDTGDDERMLILRPAMNFEESTRYLVALRNLKDASGGTIPAGPEFAAYRDGGGADPGRQAEMDRIIGEIGGAEAARGNAFERTDLFLAWEFTVASWQSLAGRALHIRNDAFARLGDFDLADGKVEGKAPAFRIDRIEQSSGDTRAYVHGSFTVPNYLVHYSQTPEAYDPTGRVTGERVPSYYSPHTRFFYPPGEDLPEVNPAQPTIEAPFTCRIPSSATPARPALPVLMGHGLLNDRSEVAWSGNLLTAQHNTMYCGTEWMGMSSGDLPEAATILLDPGLFPSLADRSQQGMLNFLYLGRLMIHSRGFASSPAFQTPDGAPLLDAGRLVYDGNSQGAVMGGALTALAPDFTRATLGVAGMNYSTMLNRSVDWEGSYGEILYLSIRDPRERQLGYAIIQMLWDRAESDGYAHHMTDRPYANTPAHQVLLHAAYGDYQVANIAAEVEARTIGARLLQRSMPASRHWSVDPTFGLEVFDAGPDGRLLPWSGSALVYWDSGNRPPPNANVPPSDEGQDPHEDPRQDVDSGNQRIRFFDTGEIADGGAADAYCTKEFPRFPALLTTCPSA